MPHVDLQRLGSAPRQRRAYCQHLRCILFQTDFAAGKHQAEPDTNLALLLSSAAESRCKKP